MEQTIAKWLSVGFRYTAMHLDRALAPLGLGSSQYKYVMRVCEYPGITQDQFFALFFVNPSNITRALVALEKEGFLMRRQNTKDRRTYQLFPTERAREVYPRIREICDDWQNRLLAGVPPESRELVLQALESIALRAVEENDKEAAADEPQP